LVPAAMAEIVHFDQLPPTGPSVGCRFGQGTFAGATRNGQYAPFPDRRRAAKREFRPLSAARIVGRLGLEAIDHLGDAAGRVPVGHFLALDLKFEPGRAGRSRSWTRARSSPS